MNSIRPDALASLLLKGEAETGNRPVKGERQFRDLSLESTVSSKIGMHGVIGDRMVGSWSDMNQGSPTGKHSLGFNGVYAAVHWRPFRARRIG